MSAHTPNSAPVVVLLFAKLPITATGSMGCETLNGTIDSGGCQLQLTNSNGNIEITKAR